MSMPVLLGRATATCGLPPGTRGSCVEGVLTLFPCGSVWDVMIETDNGSRNEPCTWYCCRVMRNASLTHNLQANGE